MGGGVVGLDNAELSKLVDITYMRNPLNAMNRAHIRAATLATLYRDV